MATKKRTAPTETKSGIDRWTNNGHGVKVQPLSAEKKAQIEKEKQRLANDKPAKKK